MSTRATWNCRRMPPPASKGRAPRQHGRLGHRIYDVSMLGGLLTCAAAAQETYPLDVRHLARIWCEEIPSVAKPGREVSGSVPKHTLFGRHGALHDHERVTSVSMFLAPPSSASLDV